MRYRIDIRSSVTLLLIINVIIYFLTRLIDIPVPTGFVESLYEKGRPAAAYAVQNNDLIITLFSLFPVLIRDLGWVWQVFTYMFLHGSPIHLFFNMYALFLFGRPLEERWGKGEFVFFYLCTGVGAGIVTFIWNLMSAPLIPTIGASGAIFGVVLAFGLEFPETVLLLFFIIPVRAKYAALIFGGIELVMILTGTMGGIGHFTHLAGLLFGYVYYLLRIRPRFGGGRIASAGGRRRLVQPLTHHRTVSGAKRRKAVQRANDIKEKIRRETVLSDSDKAFVEQCKRAYLTENGQLCEYGEFGADATVCMNCDSLFACLYRYMMSD
jgi:membrane associated rhomboid family serine protease